MKDNEENPFTTLASDIKQEMRRGVEEIISTLQGNTKNKISPSGDFLKSIKQISEFLGCCDTTSQRIKNNFPEIFVPIGKRKFLVSKQDLIGVFKSLKGRGKA